MTLAEFTQERYWMSIKEKCKIEWLHYWTPRARRNNNRHEDDIYMPSLGWWWARNQKNGFYKNYKWEKCSYRTYHYRVTKWMDKNLAILPIIKWKKKL